MAGLVALLWWVLVWIPLIVVGIALLYYAYQTWVQPRLDGVSGT